MIGCRVEVASGWSRLTAVGVSILAAIEAYDPFQHRGHWHTGPLGRDQFCAQCDAVQEVR